MNSLRLRLLMIGMRVFVKPGLRHVKEPEHARISFERSSRIFRTPPYTLLLPDEYQTQNGPRQALWISSGPVARRKVILYLHGGGYLTGSPKTHSGMLARLSRLTGLRVFAPSYRLAPENPYPAALDDAKAAFAALENKGYHPKDIVIGGDSAGGGLALALLSVLCGSGRAPVATFAFSPWTDLTLSGASMTKNAKSDVILPSSRTTEMREFYAGNTDPKDPGLSPLFAKFPNCTPVFLQFSNTEILRDDSLRMADHLGQQGAQVTTDPWPDTPHVWQIFDGLIPEAREALTTTANFITQVLGSHAGQVEN